MRELATIDRYFNPPTAGPILTGPDAPSTSCGTRRAVRSMLPAKSTLDYLNAAITALVLVLALPWLLKKLATDPAGAIRRLR